MRRLSCLLLACSALASGAARAADARPAAALKLCFERQEVLPWRTLGGAGLNFELLGEVARRTGLAFEYRSMPWKRCLEQLKANEVDGAFAVSFNPERLVLGAYPGGERADPGRRMHVDRYLLVRRKGSRVDWDGKAFRNLDGRVGFQLGYSVGEFLRAQHVPVDEGSQQSDELAQKLIAGRIAAAAMGGGDAVRLMRGPLGRELEVAPTPLVEKAYYLVLSHKFAGSQPALAARIWDTIEQVRTSPGYRKREQTMVQGGR
jgi:polar amino acid transport system substrate-binding protein